MDLFANSSARSQCKKLTENVSGTAGQGPLGHAAGQREAKQAGSKGTGGCDGQHGPPISMPRTVSWHRREAANSGYARSLARQATWRAAPAMRPRMRRGAPADVSGATSVVSKATCAPTGFLISRMHCELHSHYCHTPRTRVDLLAHSTVSPLPFSFSRFLFPALFLMCCSPCVLFCHVALVACAWCAGGCRNGDVMWCRVAGLGLNRKTLPENC